jgi:hypothetical protein
MNESKFYIFSMHPAHHIRRVNYSQIPEKFGSGKLTFMYNLRYQSKNETRKKFQ